MAVVRVVVVVGVADVFLVVVELLMAGVALAAVVDADLAVGGGFVVILGIGDVQTSAVVA